MNEDAVDVLTGTMPPLAAPRRYVAAPSGIVHATCKMARMETRCGIRVSWGWRTRRAPLKSMMCTTCLAVIEGRPTPHALRGSKAAATSRTAMAQHRRK